MTEFLADERLSKYVNTLLPRWNEAKIVPRKTVSINDAKPAPNQCHKNVADWISLNKNHKCVRGWMLFDFKGPLIWLLGQPQRLELLAHSVIEDENGILFDITPASNQEASEYPFLLHTGNEEDFVAIIADYNLSRIRIYDGSNDITYLSE